MFRLIRSDKIYCTDKCQLFGWYIEHFNLSSWVSYSLIEEVI